MAWASPFPKSFAVWVRVTEDAHIMTGVLGMPQTRACLYHCNTALLFSKEKSSGNEVGVTRAIRGGATSFTGLSPTRPSGRARALGTRLGVETLRF